MAFLRAFYYVYYFILLQQTEVNKSSTKYYIYSYDHTTSYTRITYHTFVILYRQPCNRKIHIDSLYWIQSHTIKKSQFYHQIKPNSAHTELKNKSHFTNLFGINTELLREKLFIMKWRHLESEHKLKKEKWDKMNTSFAKVGAGEGSGIDMLYISWNFGNLKKIQQIYLQLFIKVRTQYVRFFLNFSLFLSRFKKIHYFSIFYLPATFLMPNTKMLFDLLHFF